VESNGNLPPGLWLTSPAGWLPKTGISSGTLRSAIEYGLPLPFFTGSQRSRRCCPLANKVDNIDCGQVWACSSIIPQNALHGRVPGPSANTWLLEPHASQFPKRYLYRLIRFCTRLWPTEKQSETDKHTPRDRPRLSIMNVFCKIGYISYAVLYVYNVCLSVCLHTCRDHCCPFAPTIKFIFGHWNSGDLKLSTRSSFNEKSTFLISIT